MAHSHIVYLRCERRRHCCAEKVQFFPTNKFVVIPFSLSSFPLAFSLLMKSYGAIRLTSIQHSIGWRLAITPKCHCRLTERNLLSILSLKKFTQFFLLLLGLFSLLLKHPSNDDNFCPPLCISTFKRIERKWEKKNNIKLIFRYFQIIVKLLTTSQ